MPQVEPLQPGDPARLGPFTLSGRLGEGGQGVVYFGLDRAGERAAVKLLHVKFTGDATARSRFARELRAAQRVASFCTARVLAADLEGDTPYIASEFIDGRSLRETVETRGPLSGPALERLAVGTATALTAIHQAGIVHRDFKPDNVLLAVDGPRVVDFGIARILDSTATITSRAIGTPAYMAPEQISGGEVGPPADVFSWASTIAYAATGQVVFGGDSIAVVLNRILNHEIDTSMIPEPLAGVIRACLRKSPDERPTADQILLRVLGRTASDDAPAAVLSAGTAPGYGAAPGHGGPPGGGGPPVVRRPTRRRGRLIGAIVAVLVVLAAGGVLLADRIGFAFDGGSGNDGADAAVVPAEGASRSTSPSASVHEKAARTGRLTIGVRGDLPGVALQQGDGFSGFEIDLATSIAGSLGVPAEGITFRRIGVGDRARVLADGTVDMVVATYSYDDNRDDDVTFAGPYYVAHADLLVLANSRIKKLGDLTGHRMCAPSGSAAARLMADAVEVEQVPAGNYAECMDLLTSGGVDAVPGDDLLIAGFADRVRSLRLAVLGLGLRGQRYAVGLPKRDVRTCTAVARAISGLYADGTMRDLMRRHFGNVDFHPGQQAPARLACR